MAPRVRAAGLCLLAACGARPGAVPRATSPIAVDGSWSEPDWNKTALTGVFLGADGALARPASQVRLLAGSDRLYVGLYAADEDIRSTDGFDLTVGGRTLRFDAAGGVSPALPGVVAGVDRDGTLDADGGGDEEWVIEAEIPLAALGLPQGARGVPIRAARCDTPRNGVRRCASWEGKVSLP